MLNSSSPSALIREPEMTALEKLYIDIVENHGVDETMISPRFMVQEQC